MRFWWLYHLYRLAHRMVPMVGWSRWLFGDRYLIGITLDCSDTTRESGGCLRIWLYWFCLTWSLWGELGDIGQRFRPVK